MPKAIKIFDTTLRDGEQTPGVNLNISEKLEIARQLDRLGVDIIEAGFAASSPGDFQAVGAVASAIKNSTVACLCRTVQDDIDIAWEAVKHAVDPRLHIFIATSDIHMKYKLKMTPDDVLQLTQSMVRYAKKYCSNIEFSAEDATRTRPEFLYKVVQSAINEGATCVNIPDTVGYTLPSEYGKLIKSIQQNVTGIEKADISVHCHDDLGLAVSNSLAAVMNGATQVECTINGLGERAGNAAMEEIVMTIKTRPDIFNASTNIDTTQFTRTSRLVSGLAGISVPPNKAIVGANAFTHESGIHQHGVLSEKSTYEIITPESIGLTANKISLGKLSGRAAFEHHLVEMGYTLDKPALDRAFDKFKQIADKKKTVTDEDIEAIVNDKISDVPKTFILDSFQVNSGNNMISTATVSMKINRKDMKGTHVRGNVMETENSDEVLVTEAATGDGPVDALFNAIDRLCDMKTNLSQYSLKAITGGTDALGEVSVKVEKDGKFYFGRGISTDILESSARAYINALNKIVNI